MLVGEHRSEHIQQLDVTGRDRMRVVAPILIVAQSPLVRMLGRVLTRDIGDSLVLEDLDGITRHQVAAIDPLANEQRVVVRPIVISNVELVESALHVREGERRPPDPKAPVHRADPEGRIPGGHQEVRGGRTAGRTRLIPAPNAEKQEALKDMLEKGQRN